MMLALFIGGVIVLILLRVPVAFAPLVPSLVYLGLDESISTSTAFQRMTAGITVFALPGGAAVHHDRQRSQRLGHHRTAVQLR